MMVLAHEHGGVPVAFVTRDAKVAAGAGGVDARLWGRGSTNWTVCGRNQSSGLLR